MWEEAKSILFSYRGAPLALSWAAARCAPVLAADVWCGYTRHRKAKANRQAGSARILLALTHYGIYYISKAKAKSSQYIAFASEKKRDAWKMRARRRAVCVQCVYFAVGLWFLAGSLFLLFLFVLVLLLAWWLLLYLCAAAQIIALPSFLQSDNLSAWSDIWLEYLYIFSIFY